MVIGGEEQWTVEFLACPSRRFTIQDPEVLTYHLEQRMCMSFGGKYPIVLLCSDRDVTPDLGTLGHQAAKTAHYEMGAIKLTKS